MRSDLDTSKGWSVFDLEVPPPGRISYPLYAGVWDPAPPCPLTMDVHQGMEIGMVLRGKVERHFEDFMFTAGPGDVHLCAAWEPHGWRVVLPGTSQVVVIFLPQVLAEEAFREVPWLSFFMAPPRQRPRTTGAVMRRSLLAIGERIHREARRTPHHWLIALRLCLFDLLLTLDRYWQPREALPSPPIAHASNLSRLMPAVQMVHLNLTRRVTSGQAAAACQLRRSRFNAVFHETMGISFGSFRRRAQLASVAHLLLTTHLPTDAIAAETGFVDGSHMHRTFVRHYRCTPGQYRERYRSRKRQETSGTGVSTHGRDMRT
jgi:AraC-like DNA-binding protein